MTIVSGIERTAPHRYAYIDCVRGMAALFVCLQHAAEYAGFTGHRLGAEYPWPVNFGQAGVFAFFLVSGFVIPLSLERSSSPAGFWRKRIARIYPLYIFIFVATTSVYLFLQGGVIEQPLKLIIAQLLLLPPWINMPDFVPGSWTLLIEFMWYGGIFVWWLFNPKIYSGRLFALAGLFFLTVTLFAVFSPVRVPLGRLGFILACIWGLTALEHSRGGLSASRFALLSAILAALMVLITFVGFDLRPGANNESLTFPVVLASWGVGCLTFFFFYAFRTDARICNRVLIFIGTISYSLYLVHSLVFRVLIHFQVEGVPLFVLGVTASVALAYVTYTFVESPFIRSRPKTAKVTGTPA